MNEITIGFNSAPRERIESLCKRLDSSISILDAFKQKAEEFTSYVHEKDKSDAPIDFNKPKSILLEEKYKKRLYDKSQIKLNVSSWQQSWIGTGKIFDRLFPIVEDKDNNLITNFNNKTDFNDHFRKQTDKYDPRSEQVIFDLFKGDNDRLAFIDAVDVFGARYSTIAFLFFIKDATRYLPVSPENFEKCFAYLNIDISLQGNCSWESYNTFIQIIECIRELMPLYIPMAHEPSLLDAHSFIWIIGEDRYTSWLKGVEYRKEKAVEELRKKQEHEEREKNRRKTKALSEFSDEELIQLGPTLIGKTIFNRTKGDCIVTGFIVDPDMAMKVSFEDAMEKTILLTASARESYLLYVDQLNLETLDQDSENNLVTKENFIELLSIPEGIEIKQFNGMNRIHFKCNGVGFALVDMKTDSYNLATREEYLSSIGISDYDITSTLGPNRALKRNIAYGDADILYGLFSYIMNETSDNDNFEKKLIEKENLHIEEEISGSGLVGTDRLTLVKARVNQGVYRDLLIRKFKKCCICGIDEERLLIASHIKPWADSSQEERVDVNNGLLLCPNHDRLFDRGFISFDDGGVVLISDYLSKQNQLLMGISDSTKIDLTDKCKEYMKYHRENIFKPILN